MEPSLVLPARLSLVSGLCACSYFCLELPFSLHFPTLPSLANFYLFFCSQLNTDFQAAFPAPCPSLTSRAFLSTSATPCATSARYTHHSLLPIHVISPRWSAWSESLKVKLFFPKYPRHLTHNKCSINNCWILNANRRRRHAQVLELDKLSWNAHYDT